MRIFNLGDKFIEYENKQYEVTKQLDPFGYKNPYYICEKIPRIKNSNIGQSDYALDGKTHPFAFTLFRENHLNEIFLTQEVELFD